jgi:hypothetical protein
MQKAVLVIAVAIAAGLSLPAAAQQPQTVRLAGTIKTFEGNVLTVKTRDGADLRLVLTEHAQIIDVVKASPADITQGAYIGSGGVPQADGTQKAAEVHIFTESQRGTGDGHKAWDVVPNGTMTNGAVGATVTGVDGPVVTVKYKGGEKKILVTPNTPVVRYQVGSKDDLKPGAGLNVSRAVKRADGMFEADRISVRQDGTLPN